MSKVFWLSAVVIVASFVSLGPSVRAQEKPGHDHGHGHDHDHSHCDHDHDNSLVAVARKQGSLNTFSAAVTQAELVEMLGHAEVYTIFAPTDEAFAKLPPETLDKLLDPDNQAKLKALVLAHIVKGKAPSSAVKSESAGITTEQGAVLSVRRDADGTVRVNAAKVVKADIEAGNGTIHAIDTVLIPEGGL